MRQLLRRLEEAAPAPGSKEWLSGVKKWWGQWVKEADKISKIRDPKDRKVVLDWFADGGNRIRLLIDVLVRRSWLQTDPALAKLTVGAKAYKDGIARMDVPRSYTVDGKKIRPEPGELVHPHLDAALRSLEKVMSMEQYGWEDSKRSGSERRWGTTKDLDAWQSFVETLSHDISGVDIDVQAALRKYAADTKETSTQERIIADSIPLDYDLGGVKVVTDPGSLHELGMLTAPDVDLGASRVSNRTMNMIQDGLKISHQALKQRGFGKVWYGTIFVLPPSKAIMGTTNKTGKQFQAGGHYNMSDSIVVNPKANWKTDNVTGVIVHELGHRYWYKHMKAGARARFSAWFDPRTKKIQDRDGPQADFVPAPTTYGAESPVEEFAEVFAAYVLGKYEGITLTGPQKARFEALALGRAAQSEAVHGRSHGMGIRKLVERIEQVMIEWDGYDDTRTDVEALARNIVVLEPVLYNVTLLIRNNAEDAAVNAMKHARSANLSAKLNKQDQLADDILRRSEEVHDAYQTFIKAWQAARKPDAAPKELRAVVPSYSDLRTRLLKLKETIAGKPNKKKRAR